MELTVAQLAERIGAELAGDGSAKIRAVKGIDDAESTDITFISDKKHLPKLGPSRAGAVIVAKPIEGLSKPQLIVGNVDAALIEVSTVLAPELKPPAEGIDPTAKISQDARIAKGVSIGAGTVIEDGVEIDENCVIASGCKIGQNSKLGKNCRLDSNVVIYHHCRLGNHVVIQANSTIGSTGFGYALIDGAHQLIPHNGGVLIEDFVEIGANCCIDRGKFGNTIIGAGTKIDNLVQIAHNVVIGKCCLIAGCVGIAGSVRIGNRVVLAGQVGVVDHIQIGDRTIAGARSLITHNVGAEQQLFGVPATDKVTAFKLNSLIRRLPKFSDQLKQLNKRIEKIELADGKRKMTARLGWAAAAVILIGVLSSPFARMVTEPHEYDVEHVVKKYQDGNDNFYVSANSHLEDLHTGRSLFVIFDMAQAAELIASDRVRLKDSYFLVSYKDLAKMRDTTAWKQLHPVEEIDVEGQWLVLLSTETKLGPTMPGS